MKKVYIITGANGFLGNNIIRKLQQNKDNEIRALVLKNSSIESLENLNCKIYYGDVTKKDSLSDVFENINDKQVFVIHCAAVVYIKSKFNPTIYNINVNGTKNIIDKVLEKNAKLIYISSVHAIYEKPNNELMTEETDFDENKVKGLYAKTKAETTKYIMDKVFATVKGGYDFVDVRDVADGIISACEKDNKNECYILSNKYITIKDLTDLICDLQNKKRIKLVLPIFLAKLVAPFFELYYNIKKETPLFTKYSLYTLSSNANFSNAKAKKELGFKNKDIKETIKDTLIWLKEKNYIK